MLHVSYPSYILYKNGVPGVTTRSNTALLGGVALNKFPKRTGVEEIAPKVI